MAVNTKDEILKAFDKYDADRNMTLSKSEFRGILVACGISNQHVNKLFEAADRDHDGSITSKEFVGWLFKPTAQEAENMAKVAKHVEKLSYTKQEALEDWIEFMNEVKTSGRYVKMRNAVVREEGQLIKKKNKKTGKETVEKSTAVTLDNLFKSMDTNRNGKVSMSEFVTGCNRLGIDCEDEMLIELFRMIDQAKKIKKTMVSDGAGTVHDVKDLATEANPDDGTTGPPKPTVESFYTAEVKEEIAENHAKAKLKRKELRRKRHEKLKKDFEKEPWLVPDWVSSEEEEFQGALSAQVGVTTEFLQKDGAIDIKEFKMVFGGIEGELAEEPAA